MTEINEKQKDPGFDPQPEQKRHLPARQGALFFEGAPLW
jgi:hypothetical protein